MLTSLYKHKPWNERHCLLVEFCPVKADKTQMRETTVTHTPRSVAFASLLVALFIDTKAVNYVLGAIMGRVGDGFTTTLFTLIAISSMIVVMTQPRFLRDKVNLYVWLLSAFIIGFYYYTSRWIGIPRVPLPFLLGFTLMGFILPSVLKIDTRLTLRAIMTIPAIGVFWLNNVLRPEAENEFGVVSMMRSYAFLVPVMANILYILLYYKRDHLSRFDSNLFFWLITCINSIYFFKMLSSGSRGPFFCIVSLIIFHWAVKKDESGKLRWNLGRNLTIGMAIIAISTFFRDVMFGLSTLLHWFGLHLNVIDKFVRKAVESGDMTNGREVIYVKCMEEIPEKPFYGHGMDLFEHYTDIAYPHNFILQIFYDGGLMLALILLVPVIWYMIKKIRFGSYETYSMTIFLLFVSVPGALMSSDLWQNERLWLFFGAMLSTSFIYKQRRRYKP